MKLSCDVCGRDDVRAVILIEGAKMVACGSCARSNKILYRLDENEEGHTVELKPKRKGPMDSSEEVVEGYGLIIRKAREKSGLKISVIAEKINEKESYLDAIENERLTPTFLVARKLERELGIKLIEKVTEEIVGGDVKRSGKFSEPTLGDALMSAKKKKEK
jgi:putative transcription factor